MQLALTALLFLLLYVLGWHYGRREGQRETMRAFLKQGYNMRVEAPENEEWSK